MKTRKEINDKDSNRSVYVVEINTVANYWSFVSAHDRHRQAVQERERLYTEYKTAYPSIWTRKHFRIALYARAE